MGDELGVPVEPVRVLLADDDGNVREALSELIEAEPTLRLVAVAQDATEATMLARQHRPDVAVLDVRMPGGGDHAARDIRTCSPRTRVIALSAYDDQRAVVGMVASGATSYLVKGASGNEIISAIQRAAAGESVLSEAAASRVVGELGHQIRLRDRDLVDREDKLARIDQALGPGAMEMVYQPVVDLGRRHRCGIEALARFRLEPARTPDVWFAEAWEVGLGVELELAAVAAALPVLDQLPTQEFLAVNLSPQTVVSPGFERALGRAPRHRLVLELTEHARVGDYDALRAALHEPRRAGLRVASDDTGAGYASLQHILRLAPEIIKLDISLTRGVDSDRRRRALVAALVAFANEVGATTIAEGIETETELATLRAFGAMWGQGYLLHRPVPLSALELPRPTDHPASPRRQGAP